MGAKGPTTLNGRSSPVRTGQHPQRASIAAGRSGTASVTFALSATGSATRILIVTSSAAGSPLTVARPGTGATPPPPAWR